MDFAKAMEEERNRLKTEIETLTKAIAALNQELKALDTYDRAKSGAAPSGKRRSSVRQDVLNAISSGFGITRAEVLVALDAKDNIKATKSVSNALFNLKKQGKIKADDAGSYKIA